MTIPKDQFPSGLSQARCKITWSIFKDLKWPSRTSLEAKVEATKKLFKSMLKLTSNKWTLLTLLSISLKPLQIFWWFFFKHTWFNLSTITTYFGYEMREMIFWSWSYYLLWEVEGSYEKTWVQGLSSWSIHILFIVAFCLHHQPIIYLDLVLKITFWWCM